MVAALALALPATCARAQDCPQWGGTPHRNMYATVKGLPARFDAGKFKPGTEEVDLATTRNVKRVLKLGSQSYGNVTVAGGRIFVGTNNENPRNKKHTGDRSILMCFDEKTGAFLWQLVVPKLASGKVNDWESLGLLSSPTIEGDRIYLVTSRCEVMCLDVQGLANGNDGSFQDEAQYIVGPGKPKAELTPQDADIIWKYDMMDDLGVFPHNASNCSVILVDDLVFACTSNGQDWTHSNIPAPLAPSFIALDQKTGELRGEDNAGIGSRLFHGQWSSPSMGEVNGRKLVFFGAGDGWCYAFDSKPVKENDDHFLKVVWKYDCNPPEYKVKDGKPIKYPDANGPSEINATPVFYKNRIYVAIGQDPEHGEGIGRLVCLDATKTGDITSSGTIWDFKGIHRSISTVSIDPDQGLLFVGDFSGFVYCLDAETGKLHWTHDMKAHMWGSTLVADGKVYCGDEDGDLVVFASSAEKKILSTVMVDGRPQDGPNLGAPVYSTPVAANGVLYIATSSHLYGFADFGKPPAEPVKP
jgi:outer membrane protein assembly factor BamB